MNAYEEIIRNALIEQGLDVMDVKRHTGIRKIRIQNIINGSKQATVEELFAISTYLSLDVNQLLGIKEKDNTSLVLDDPFQIKLNSISKTIQKKYQNDFVKAVEYLADCFVMKDKQKK